MKNTYIFIPKTTFSTVTNQLQFHKPTPLDSIGLNSKFSQWLNSDSFIYDFNACSPQVTTEKSEAETWLKKEPHEANPILLLVNALVSPDALYNAFDDNNYEAIRKTILIGQTKSPVYLLNNFYDCKERLMPLPILIPNPG